MTATTTTAPDLLQALLGEAFIDAERRHTRSQQREVGISALGGCRAQAAMQHHGVPPTEDDTDERRAARLGTWLHQGLLPALRRQMPGSRVELPVVWHPDLDLPPMPGHLDLLWPAGKLLIDVKTVGSNELHRTRLSGPRPRSILQVHGYADAVMRRGYPHGKGLRTADVDAIALLYVARDTGEAHVVPMAYDPDVVVAATAWWRNVTQADPATDLAYLRDERGPGLSIICDHCLWLRACWGPEARPENVGPQRLPDDVEPDAIASAAAMYAQAQLTEKEAKQTKEFARALLEGVPAGTYGAWRVTWSKGRSYLDQKTATELIEGFGAEPPIKRGSPAISVRAAGTDG